MFWEQPVSEKDPIQSNPVSRPHSVGNVQWVPRPKIHVYTDVVDYVKKGEMGTHPRIVPTIVLQPKPFYIHPPTYFCYRHFLCSIMLPEMLQICYRYFIKIQRINHPNPISVLSAIEPTAPFSIPDLLCQSEQL